MYFEYFLGMTIEVLYEDDFAVRNSAVACCKIKGNDFFLSSLNARKYRY